MAREPLITVRVAGEDVPRTLVFEPIGSEHQLGPGDEVLVHIFGEPVGVRPDMHDLYITAGRDRLELLITSSDYAVWDKSGAELPHL